MGRGDQRNSYAEIWAVKMPIPFTSLSEIANLRNVFLPFLIVKIVVQTTKLPFAIHLKMYYSS